MNTVTVKIYTSDKCNQDWIQSNRTQRTALVANLKQFAKEFDYTLHCATFCSPTIERGEAFAEVTYNGELADDLQVEIQSTIKSLCQDATQQMDGMRFVLKVVDIDTDIIFTKING